MIQQKGVPGMSATASNYITDILLARKNVAPKYFVIEYGAGYSTEFFINQLVKHHVGATYVAVERDPWWYGEMQKMFPGGILAKQIWSIGEYFRFITAKPQNVWEVPEACRRLEREQKKMRSLKSIGRFLLERSRFWFDASYRLKINEVRFECPYVLESFKDQFGESPRKEKYIGLPLESLRSALASGKKCHALILIDGGPRADVVRHIFSLIDTYKNLTVDIFLLEAYRGYYQTIISSRPGGRFIAAEKNERLDGTLYLEGPAPSETVSECAKLIGVTDVVENLKRELWHFTNV